PVCNLDEIYRFLLSCSLIDQTRIFTLVAMHLFLTYHSQRQLLYLTAILIFGLSAFVPGTNLTQQYQTCKTDEQIEALRQTHGLILVDAVPTHGALQPGWPETLITVGICIYTIVTGPDPGSEFIVFLFGALIPFVLVLAWLISFVIAQIN